MQVAQSAAAIYLNATGQDAPAAGLTWDVVRNGSSVATSNSPNGWTVNFVTSYPNNLLQVSAPSTAPSAMNYEVRFYASAYSLNASVFCDVCPVGQVPHAATVSCSINGSDAPAAGLQWDVLLNGDAVGSATQPRGWAVSPAGAGNPIPVTPPLTASPVSGYEVRVNNGSEMDSATFQVIGNRVNYNTDPKTLILANGAQVSFTPAAVPSVAQPVVSCTTGGGVPIVIEWDYEAGNPGGHYTLRFGDQSQWITTGPMDSVNATAVNYQLSQVKGRNDNAITMVYGGIGFSGFHLLTSIQDASNSSTLLTLTPTADVTGNIQSVSDAYQRSVSYQYGTYANQFVGAYPNYQEVNWVSQVVPTGTANPPMRWQYDYAVLAQNGDTFQGQPEKVRFLSSIKVPSPKTPGTMSTAAINYDTTTGFVTSVVDANLNTRTYTQVPGQNQTQVTITNPTNNPTFSFSYKASYGTGMQLASLTDGIGTNPAMTANYPMGAPDPYRPGSVTTGLPATAAPARRRSRGISTGTC